MGRKAKHDKTDWLLAAFKTLGEEGIDGVKVERIAKKLNTTKGSFYWHFADRPALLTQMLEFWEQEGTHEIINALDDQGNSASEKLRALARLSTATQIHGLDSIAVEGALRAWAGQEPWVGDRIRATERARIEYVAHLLEQMGYDNPSAKEIAHQLYLMLLGLYSIMRHDPHPGHSQAFIAFADQLADKSR
ncbi:TetR/AcrR family transcriptional regulator [Maritalea porphyrae]|jgi:AcrR family transcriptional regulator|uniref:TetR/AcrR family transcriptional regulator n=1 Tax=Maritalea porphyrae TaxID=880732 RepID=UPI0022AECDDD|nr:TetR/AcrR family transcriptional regulator [Maritalea porphyrae]MCZ4271881.1 TetR/AcrR family transcriptional regulator [Maritalea porphyrae]